MIAASASASVRLSDLVKAQAYGLGFDLVGITDLGPVETAHAFDAWLARGYAGDMAYLERGAEKRRDSRLPFEGVTHAVVVGMSYGGREPSGPVARYARGDDYHDLMVERLNALHRWIESHVSRPVRGKAYVDTGPLLERDLARRAGLGWFGKNTTLINPRAGSFFFLGALVVDLALDVDAPFTTEHCGTCHRCIDACPTDALVEPRVLDSNRCISYLTIEQKGEIPLELRPLVGELLYGCDICQEVCPWNAAAPVSQDPSWQPREVWDGATIDTLSAMPDEQLNAALDGSAMSRTKVSGLRRNLAVVRDNLAGPASGTARK